MDEYINRFNALSALGEYVDSIHPFTTIDIMRKSEIICCKQVISNVPAADVVEVVRCKDCIHRPSRIYGAEDEREGLNLEFPDDWCPMQCEDGWYNRMPSDDFFCGYGEET